MFARTVLACPHCGGARKVLAFLTGLFIVRKILSHLGLATKPPHVARRPRPALGHGRRKSWRLAF